MDPLVATTAETRAEVVGFNVKPLHWVQKELPAQKTEAGYQHLSQGFAVLEAEFDNMSYDVRVKLLDRHNSLLVLYEGSNPEDLKLSRCLKNFDLLESMASANKFYHDSKLFKEDVQASVAEAHRKILLAKIEGR
ncbi:hypothetical protein B0H12DRAFT_1070659 [Mycena haematopus]|nr:hypothetical protein B0H12DRAFT_1070659 [Mycena haematopus]